MKSKTLWLSDGTTSLKSEQLTLRFCFYFLFQKRGTFFPFCRYWGSLIIHDIKILAKMIINHFSVQVHTNHMYGQKLERFSFLLLYQLKWSVGTYKIKKKQHLNLEHLEFLYQRLLTYLFAVVWQKSAREGGILAKAQQNCLKLSGVFLQSMSSTKSTNFIIFLTTLN